MGVRLPVEMDPPRAGGSGLAGRGCATAEAGAEEMRGNINRDGGENAESHLDTGPPTPEADASLLSLGTAF